MQQLLQFIYRNGAFFAFLLLEIICGWLIVYNNNYQGAAYFNSANRISGNIMTLTSNINSYFNLREVNEQLAFENEKLRNYHSKSPEVKTDTIKSLLFEVASNNYEYTYARVVNNSVFRFSNFITINKGSADGIESGMGVISADGVVGKVKSVSENFSTVYSLLNTAFYVSAKIKETNTYCTVKWDGKSPAIIDLLYVPRHIDIENGFEVVTSGYNAIFPEGILIGKINKVEIGGDASFYHIEAVLSVDFQSLSYLYVIKNSFKDEQLILEEESTAINE